MLGGGTTGVIAKKKAAQYNLAGKTYLPKIISNHTRGALGNSAIEKKLLLPRKVRPVKKKEPGRWKIFPFRFLNTLEF